MSKNIKRWWYYQLVQDFDADGNEYLTLKEVFWKQIGKRKPTIWLYQDAQINAASVDDFVALMNTIIKDAKKHPVVPKKSLPSPKKMEAEYEKVFAE
jgi:hypothetical protein